jgi:hypothetical protein
VGGPFVTATHPQHGFSLAGNKQQTVRHGTGEIIKIDFAEYRYNLPIRVGRVHAGAETIHPGLQFHQRHLYIHRLESHALGLAKSSMPFLTARRNNNAELHHRAIRAGTNPTDTEPRFYRLVK